MTLNRTTLVVAAVAIGAMCLAACKPAEAELTARDLSGPANLSATDRTALPISASRAAPNSSHIGSADQKL
jgi:hypothetical protein